MIRGVDPGSQPPAMRVLLHGALIPIAAVGALATVLGAVRSLPEMVGALIGTALAGLAFSVGPLIMGMAQNWSPPAVMAAAMGGYLIVIGALALSYLALLPWEWISHPALGWTLLACAAASLAGQIRAASRVRVLAFGSPAGTGADSSPRSETPGQPGKRAAPHTRGD